MKKIFLTLMIFTTLFISIGCSPMIAKYRVTVDAITAPNSTVIPTSYTIQALGDNTDTNSLKFQQQTKTLIAMLNSKGFTQTTEANMAQQIIYFDYGIEKVKEETQTYSEPNVTFGMSWGFPYGYYGRHYHPYNSFWYGGHTTYRKTYAYYNRYITLLSKEQTGKELWRVDVSSIGESKNLKQIVPMLIEATDDYIGKNTSEPVKIIMKENSAKKNSDKKE